MQLTESISPSKLEEVVEGGILYYSLLCSKVGGNSGSFITWQLRVTGCCLIFFSSELYSTKENREGQRKRQHSFFTILELFSIGNSEMTGVNNIVYKSINKVLPASNPSSAPCCCHVSEYLFSEICSFQDMLTCDQNSIYFDKPVILFYYITDTVWMRIPSKYSNDVFI